MGPEYGWGHGFGFMWIFPVIFLIVLLFFMRGMFGRGSMGCGSHGDSSSDRSASPSKESARDILDKRFARGEITKEEYEVMKITLGNGA